MVNILVTRPNKRGDPTSYTYTWGEEAVKMMINLGYSVIDIRSEDVNYENVTSAIREYKPRLYLHVGHGCPTALVGQNECVITRKFSLDELLGMENFLDIVQPLNYATGCKYACKLEVLSDICGPICQYNTNVGLLKDTIVMAIACYSASQLGKCAIKAGASGYVGYDDLMLFPVDQMKSENIFKDVHIEFIRELLEGGSINDAEKKMNKYEDSMITIYKRTKYVALPLIWNKVHRKVLGNRDASMFY